MSKRKDFRDLFGGDSDEENGQIEFSSITTKGKVKNKSETAQSNDKYRSQDISTINYKSVQKRDSNTEKHTNTVEKEHSCKEKDFKITTHDSNRKRVKTQHEDNKLQIFFDKVSANSVEVNNEKNSLSHSKSHQNGEQKKVKLKKMEIGGLVVKLLTPAYVEKRFDSRDTFKMLARNISHALHDKDEHEIKEYIKQFLNKNEEFTSHTSL